jgi:hypothetical protein
MASIRTVQEVSLEPFAHPGCGRHRPASGPSVSVAGARDFPVLPASLLGFAVAAR